MKWWLVWQLALVSGLVVGIIAEVNRILINEVTGDKIVEAVNYGIEKATIIWKEFDQSLTDEQAKTLSAATMPPLHVTMQKNISKSLKN